jgi:hypothetical protein
MSSIHCRVSRGLRMEKVTSQIFLNDTNNKGGLPSGKRIKIDWSRASLQQGDQLGG